MKSFRVVIVVEKAQETNYQRAAVVEDVPSEEQEDVFCFRRSAGIFYVLGSPLAYQSSTEPGYVLLFATQPHSIPWFRVYPLLL